MGHDEPGTPGAGRRDATDAAASIIDALAMQPHPEGGHYVETWRGAPGPHGRSVGTAIHFLLRAGERSHWHRVDADEVWLYHAGAPLRLAIASDASVAPAEYLLGVDLAAGERPQVVVPALAWQAAESTGAYTLVSCTVAPGFDFAGFELARPEWTPGLGVQRAD